MYLAVSCFEYRGEHDDRARHLDVIDDGMLAPGHVTRPLSHLN